SFNCYNMARLSLRKWSPHLMTEIRIWKTVRLLLCILSGLDFRYMMKIELRLLQKLDHVFELQLPLLINNKLVSDEITNIRGPKADSDSFKLMRSASVGDKRGIGSCWVLRFDDYKTTYEEKKKDETTRD
ncbi:hypothetical protein Tco_1434514, partial [Tanacetum coccineum]